ncbi:MAG: efflux RND transporter periplasmic adaptor subunit [Lachnospiraceae bacterium]|nr:efflux RND transporter periplasmic adaptor subunit [Lachnospiraceae bacterium]MDY5521866.1 efflux RND transporter periplasmic adaptor subunit [Agathobacter sp.]
MRKNGRQIIAVLMAGIMATLSGCGNSASEEASASIELLEPVNAASNTELAAYRDFYDYKVVAGTVYPYVQEYSFDQGVVLTAYENAPGETVEKGSVLVKADDTSVQQQIDAMEKNIEKLTQSYEDTQDSFATGNGQSQEELEMAKRHSEELYQLDLEYNSSCLERLKQKQVSYQLTSGMSGTIVSTGAYMPGTYVEAGTPLVAVADDSQKLLKCEYINKTDVAKCEDLYAFIQGKRYEVTYQPYEQAAYDKIIAEGNVAYSTFVIDDPGNEIKQGEFAVLTLVYSRMKQVLSIPKNAVHEDATGSYVYCVVNGVNEYTKVKTGANDGTYIEVTEGLEAGDPVLIADSVNAGAGTTEVTRGDFTSAFEGKGFIAYPLSYYVTNPIEYGTACFTEYKVDVFQKVQAGDVIACIHVKADNAAILEEKLQLQRAQERLQDMIDAGEEAKVISRKKEYVEELKESLSQMQADSETTEIRAGESGIVFWLEDLSGEDEIRNGAPIAMIANGSQCFLTVKNENQQLNYGNKVSIEYMDQNRKTQHAEGTIVTIGAAGLSSDLKREEAYIRIPEAVADYIQDRVAEENIADFFKQPQFNIKTEIRTVSDVLLVPKKAVTVLNGKTYVYVKHDDGTITTQNFIAGGSNETDYWVLEGLEEGMTICLE